MNCRRVVAAVGAACVAGSVLALPVAAQEGTDPPAQTSPEAPVGDLPAAEAPLVESRPPVTRPPVVEETVPETVPETTIAPTTLPAPPPSYPMGTVPPPQLGRSARSTTDAHEDMHADAPAATTEHGNQALEAVLVALTVSLLAGGFWSARRYS